MSFLDRKGHHLGEGLNWNFAPAGGAPISGEPGELHGVGLILALIP